MDKIVGPTVSQVVAYYAPVPRKRLHERLATVTGKIARLEKERQKLLLLEYAVSQANCIFRGVPMRQSSLDVITGVAGEPRDRAVKRDAVYSDATHWVLRFEWVEESTCGHHVGRLTRVHRFRYSRLQRAKAVRDAKLFVATGRYPTGVPEVK